jgi:hypothetical protein
MPQDARQSLGKQMLEKFCNLRNFSPSKDEKG